eukprot:TRINITY_DN8190_c0_g1_i1.p1 TRINITY_DN8190_c0_g1~~TRINITY_DN8190_c0_g1_i1.p1  ORF type:complete len:341 (-),score=63.72 TRINITY_DN8190_c0_g1_i1:45-1067(-)
MSARAITMLLESKLPASENHKHLARLTCVSESYIIKIQVKQILNDLLLLVSGRSRFCNYLAKSKFFTYYCRTQYKELRRVHGELANALRVQTRPNSDILKMPEFPDEGMFKGKKEADRQMEVLNEYFDRLYCVYGQYVIYSEVLINLCAPTPIDLLILPTEKKLMDLYLNSAMIKLFNLPKPDGDEQSPACNKKALWRKYIPFDYLVKEYLFRIDIINQHLSSKSSLCGFVKCAGNIFVLMDGSREDCVKELGDTLSAIGNSKASQTRANVVAIMLNEEKDVTEELKKVLAGSLGKRVKFAYIKCSTATGENLLEPFDLLLNYCISVSYTHLTLPTICSV